MRLRLDEVARLTGRSRSLLVREALERHLDSVVREQERAEARDSRIAKLLALEGAGRALSGFKTTEQIDAMIRAFRGDD